MAVRHATLHQITANSSAINLLRCDVLLEVRRTDIYQNGDAH